METLYAVESRMASRAESLILLAALTARGRKEASNSPVAQSKPSKRLRGEVPSFGDAEIDGRTYWSCLMTSVAMIAGDVSVGIGIVLQHRPLNGKRTGDVTLAHGNLKRADEHVAMALRKLYADGARKAETKELAWRVVGAAISPFLLIDDIKPDQVDALDQYDGVAIVETSPRNLQVTLVAPRLLKEDEVKCCNKALAARFGLTNACVAARQLRRFPMSINRKPALEGNWFVSKLFCAPRPGTLTNAQLDELLAEGALVPDAPAVPLSAAVVATSASSEGDGPSASKASPKTVRRSIDGASDSSPSGMDYAFTHKELGRVSGFRGDRLIDAVAERALDRGKYAGNAKACRAYAERTVNAAIAERAARHRPPEPGSRDVA